MKLNKDKCKVLIAGNKCEHMWLDVGNNRMWESKSEKMLGILIDNSLKFDNYVAEICRKASRKFTALARLTNILPLGKMKILMASFFISQFSYCPLIWMFYNRKTNEKINKLHERSLRIVYNDDNLSFNDLLRKDKSVIMHVRNLRLLATKMFKVKNNLSPSSIVELFPKFETGYNLRNKRSQGVVITGCCRHKVLSSQGVVVTKCYDQKVLSSQGVVITRCCHHKVLSSQGVVITRCCRHKVLSSQGVVITKCCHHKVLSS